MRGRLTGRTRDSGSRYGGSNPSLSVIFYEEVYLHAYDSVSEARNGLERYLTFYNHHRPHSTLDGSTSDEVYFGCREYLPDVA